MPIVEVKYMVPVIATVDTNDEGVNSVVVDSEMIRLAPESNDRQLYTPEGNLVDEEFAEEAIRIAESDTWPIWDR